MGGGLESVGISSLVTFLENTSEYRRAVREREYGSLARTASSSGRRRERLDEIRAPLFVEHGHNDPRVPVSESEALHGVLDGRGVPCELVIYEDEGHRSRSSRTGSTGFERMVAFLDRVTG